ncbi:MAG: ABC transporter substrate-binding protein [Dehalococcoidia bacterium]|nr:MAG: ABC transporter substrate-binding protein [Dehalococcoidia bacterium]
MEHRLDDLIAREGQRLLDRRSFLALSAGAAALAACSPTTTGSTSPAPGGGRLSDTLTIGAPTISDTLDPHGTLSNSGFQAARQMFDALVTFNDAGTEFQPQLAVSWTRIDPLTMEFKLRDDVKFSNGEPFTAEVVKFNVERIQNSTDPIHANSKTRVNFITAVEPVNSTTVRIKTATPFPLLLNYLTMLFMVPPEYVRNGGDMKTKPIGTGSFKLVEFVTANRIVYEAWDGSWRGKSKIQSARLLAIAEEATLLSALRTGEVDMVLNAPGDKVAGLQADFNVTRVPSMSCTIMGIIQNTPAFADRRVREAAKPRGQQGRNCPAHLWRLRESLARAIAPAGDLWLQRKHQGGAVRHPERARSLIRQAGFEGAEAVIGSVAATQPLATAVAGYLNNVGLRSRVQIYEFPVFVPQITTKSDNPLVSFRTDYFALRDLRRRSGLLRRPPAGLSRLLPERGSSTGSTPNRRSSSIKRSASNRSSAWPS